MCFRSFWFCLPWLVLAPPLPAQNDTNSPAARAVLKFMRGINLGNALEYGAGDPAGGLVYTAQDFAQIRAEGFDHVRIPVGWHLYAGPGPAYTLAGTIFTRADAMVNQALAQGLAVLINLHRFTEMNANPGGSTNKFYAIWQQVAAHYSDAANTVAFELLNEPAGAATTAVMNPIYAEAIRRVRLTNPDRTLFIGPGNYNGLDDLPRLALPANDRNLVATVHTYDPYYFTHQGASWAYPDTLTTGVVYPGPPAAPLAPDSRITHTWVHDWFRDYSSRPTAFNPSSMFAFRSKLERARAWSLSNGRPVYVGEFGCYERAAASSRLRFHQEIRNTMDELGLPWAMWDWKAGFHYIKNGVPEPSGMREAIFPPPALKLLSHGAFEINSAVGKTLVVERAIALAGPNAWQGVSTQTLLAPKFVFTDPAAPNQTTAFYRVRWVK